MTAAASTSEPALTATVTVTVSDSPATRSTLVGEMLTVHPSGTSWVEKTMVWG